MSLPVRLLFLLLTALLLQLSCAAPPLPPPATPTTGPDPEVPAIRVRIYPRVALPPIARVNIEILIARHPDNRRYCLEVDGPGLYSSSCENLPGDDAPFLHVRAILAIAVEGSYVVTAAVYRAGTPETPFATAYDVISAGMVEASFVQ